MSTLPLDSTTATTGTAGNSLPHRRGKALHDAANFKPSVVVVQNENEPMVKVVPNHPVVTATVRRQFLGTGPFDQNWWNWDGCGLLCATITYSLHAFGVYAVTTVLIPPWMSVLVEGATSRQLTVIGWFHTVSFTTWAVLAVLSHFTAMTTDPGAVPPDAKPLEEELAKTTACLQNLKEPGIDLESQQQHLPRRCRRCRSYKPPRAHHCSICRRCVVKMDHHCPWINNCVGIGNHKYFLLFLLYTFLSCVHALALTVARFSGCTSSHAKGALKAAYVPLHPATAVLRHVSCLDRPTQLIAILGLLVESILFGLFTFCMMVDQSEVVMTKMTHIDRFKGVEATGSLSGFAEIFGIQRGVRQQVQWLAPWCRVRFPSRLQEEVLGYCRPANAESNVMAELAPMLRPETV